MDLGKLRDLREDSDLTQEDLGKIVGTNKVSVCNWEKGRENIPLEKLNICANFFNVSIDYLLKLSNSKQIDMINKELDKMIIAKNIKTIRKENNLTQRDLATILNTTQSTIWAYEKGKTLILTAFAYQICVTYNISFDWLLGKSKIKTRKHLSTNR